MCSPHEFYCACEGYLNKVDREAQMMGVASYMIHRSIVTKPLPYNQYWLFRSRKDNVSTTQPKKLIMDEVMMKQIMKIHGFAG